MSFLRTLPAGADGGKSEHGHNWKPWVPGGGRPPSRGVGFPIPLSIPFPGGPLSAKRMVQHTWTVKSLAAPSLLQGSLGTWKKERKERQIGPGQAAQRLPKSHLPPSTIQSPGTIDSKTAGLMNHLLPKLHGREQEAFRATRCRRVPSACSRVEACYRQS